MLLLSGVGVAITETGSSDSYLHNVTVVPPGLWAALFSSLQGRRFHQGPQGEIQMLTDGVWVSESSRGNILGIVVCSVSISRSEAMLCMEIVSLSWVLYKSGMKPIPILHVPQN